MEKQASSEPRGPCPVKVEIKVQSRWNRTWKLLRDLLKVEQCWQHCGEITVKRIETENNTRNCVRMNKSTRPDGSKTLDKERPLSVDEKNDRFTYQLEDNNFGFTLFKGTPKILDASDSTSVVEWSSKRDATVGAPVDVAVSLMNEMFVVTVKLAEKHHLESVETVYRVQPRRLKPKFIPG